MRNNIEKAWKLLPVKCLEICGTASLSGVKAFEIFMICTCLRYGFTPHLFSAYYLKDNVEAEKEGLLMYFLGYGFFAVVSRNQWDPVEITSPKQLYIITCNPRQLYWCQNPVPFHQMPGGNETKQESILAITPPFYSQGICTTSHQYPLYLPLHWAIISLLRPNFFANKNAFQ